MDLGECKKKGIIKKTKIDKNLVQSLMEMSDIKEKTIEQVELNEVTINAFLPIAYDSLREILEAYCILHGFKVGNHDCLGKLSKQLEPDFDIASFDRFRYARNGINYYGTKIDLTQGKILIETILKLKHKMVKKTKKILSQNDTAN